MVSASFSSPRLRLLSWRRRRCRLGRIVRFKLAERNDLDARIGRRGRTIDILQLFLAKSKRLKPLRRHLEGVHEHIPDRIRRAAGSGSDCGRAGRRIRRDRRSDSGRAAISDRSARRRCCRWSGRKPAGSGRSPGRTRCRNGFAAVSTVAARSAAAFAAGRSALALIRSAACWRKAARSISASASDCKLLDDICGRSRRLRAGRRRWPGQHGQGAEQQADVSHPPPHRTHQRYPAAVIALLQFGVAFLVDSSRHCRPLTGSARTSPQSLFNSQLQSFTSEVRAVMRCWMAPRAVG